MKNLLTGLLAIVALSALGQSRPNFVPNVTNRPASGDIPQFSSTNWTTKSVGVSAPLVLSNGVFGISLIATNVTTAGLTNYGNGRNVGTFTATDFSGDGASLTFDPPVGNQNLPSTINTIQELVDALDQLQGFANMLYGTNGIVAVAGQLDGNGGGVSNAVDIIAGTGLTVQTNADNRSFTLSASGSSATNLVNKVSSITNAWAGPTNTFSLNAYDQFYIASTPMLLTNVSGSDGTNHSYGVLSLTNVTSSNLLFYSAASIIFEDRTNVHYVTTNSFAKVFLDIGPTGTNAVFLNYDGVTVGVIGSGTIGKHAKFIAANAISDSLISESGTNITAAGNLVFSPNNTYDIGTNAATMPRDIYAARSFLSTNGTAAIPSFGFANDNDGSGTGLYRSGANSIGFTVNGVNEVNLDGSDFQLVNNNLLLGSGGTAITLHLDGNATLELGADSASPTAKAIKSADGLGTDKSADDLRLSAGNGTGTAAGGDFITTTTPPGTASGSSQNTRVVRLAQKAGQVTLTETTATTVATISVAAAKFVGGTCHLTVFASDGTDHQSTTTTFTFDAVNKAGTVTGAVEAVPSTSTAVSAGTLTVAVTAAASGNNITLQANATSSLTQTSLYAMLQIQINGTDGITVTVP